MDNSLFKIDEADYGPLYKNHLFEQYKLYLEGAEKTSDRRQSTNNYFIAINGALVSTLGLIFQVKQFNNLIWIKPLLAFVGIIICIIFWILIRSYKQLNTGKFAVIHEIEERLPLALYGFEWKILKEGKDKNIYYPFSHVELLIPWVFGFIYFVLGLAALLAK